MDEIKVLFLQGKISHDDAKEMAIKPLRIMNEEAKKIAKKFGRRHKIITFGTMIR